MAVPDGDIDALTPRRRPRIGPAGLAAVSIALMVGPAVTGRTARVPIVASDAEHAVEVSEGRYAVNVPPHWTVARVTGGPGSRRLQASSPADPAIALHITGSYAPETTLAQAADVLSRAMSEQPAGVFVDLRADAEVEGRPAVTYREVRQGRVIDWTVVLSGATRIGIGCQSPVGREGEVLAACAQAVQSARESGTDPAR